MSEINTSLLPEIYACSETSNQSYIPLEGLVKTIFSIETSINNYEKRWNQKVYNLFKNLSIVYSYDAWKLGIDARTIFIDTFELVNDKYKIQNRPMTISEVINKFWIKLQSIEKQINETKVKTNKAVAKYLVRKFIDLLDTSNSYIDRSLIQVNNRELIFVPFSQLGLSSVATFVLLDDTPGSLTADRYIKVNTAGNAVEFAAFGDILKVNVVYPPPGPYLFEDLPSTTYAIIVMDTSGDVAMYLSPIDNMGTIKIVKTSSVGDLTLYSDDNCLINDVDNIVLSGQSATLIYDAEKTNFWVVGVDE